MENNKQQNNSRSVKSAYAGFLFRSFIKRPFGYVIALLFVVYLAVILIIVPKVMKVNPLFIWTFGGFNIPTFNLYFIAASAAALAVCIFRTGREDGTDLNISSKPITKKDIVGIKTLVFIAIMVCFCLLCEIVVALVLPIFGKYDAWTNPHGILIDKYVAVLLSVFIGNLINFLIFGSLAVLVSMIGGQVVTMVTTVGTVFVMCLLNFIYPVVTTSVLDVIDDKYNTEMLTYSANTLGQYLDDENQSTIDPYMFAAIQCITDQDGQELNHLDTKETWDAAYAGSSNGFVRYIDFSKQLASLYSTFGLDDSKLKEASKLSIGTNSSFRYDVIKDTHIATEDNLKNHNYPLCIYGLTTSQGMIYPKITFIGGDMTIDKQNWYAWSVINQYDFNSVTYESDTAGSRSRPGGTTDEMREVLQNKTWHTLSELKSLTDIQKNFIDNELYDKCLELYVYYVEEKEPNPFSDAVHNIVVDYGKNILYNGKYDDLSWREKTTLMSKVHMRLAYDAFLRQTEDISNYTFTSTFPFKSIEVVDWYLNHCYKEEQDFYWQERFIEAIFNEGITVGNYGSETEERYMFDRLVTAKMTYAETYANLYQYRVEPAYNLTLIFAVWTCVAIIFFSSSIIIYRKTDFK